MKFACPKCNTRYSVSDSKVPANKVVRFTCKNCSHVIRLKRKATAPAAAPAAKKPTRNEDATQVASLAEINALKRSSAKESPEPQGHWFVLVQGKQRGPHTITEIKGMVSSGEVDIRNYGWREGMADWKRLTDIPEFARPAAGGASNYTGSSEATVTMDASQLRSALAEAQREKEALSSPSPRLSNDGLNAATQQMSAAQLKRELARVEAEDSSAGPSAAAGGTLTESTVTLSADELRAKLEEARAEQAQNELPPVEEMDPAEPTVTMDSRQLRQELAKLNDATPAPDEPPDLDFDEPAPPPRTPAPKPVPKAKPKPKPKAKPKPKPKPKPPATAQLHAMGREPSFSGASVPPQATVQDMAPVELNARSAERPTSEMAPIEPLEPLTTDPTAPAGEEPFVLGQASTQDMPASDLPAMLAEEVTEPPVMGDAVDDEYVPFGKADTTVVPATKRATAPVGSDVIAALTGEPTGEKLSRDGGDDGFYDDDDDDFQDERYDDGSSNPFELGGGPAEGYHGDDEGEYLDAPPGEATRIFMATAGIYKRRRRHRIAAVIGTLLLLTLSGVVAGDLFGLYQIPGMGLVYDVTGFEDPNVDRAIERVQTKLSSSEISTEEREKLRSKLLGLSGQSSPTKKKGKQKAKAKEVTQGIVEDKQLNEEDRKLAEGIFGDNRKKETKVKLKPVAAVQTPNLPDGLTQEAIVKVIEENRRSMGLCIAEALKGGEKLPGKLEVEMTINATGAVSQVVLNTADTSAMSTCTKRTVKRWKFPRFNGEPVPVSFPFVLSAGI